MRLEEIQQRFTVVIPTQNRNLFDVVIEACPHLLLMAREFAADYYECEPSSLGQATIKDYLLMRHEYDAIDISKIVEGINCDYQKEGNK
jgi:hypothetical protein